MRDGPEANAIVLSGGLLVGPLWFRDCGSNGSFHISCLLDFVGRHTPVALVKVELQFPALPLCGEDAASQPVFDRAHADVKMRRDIEFIAAGAVWVLKSTYLFHVCHKL